MTTTDQRIVDNLLTMNAHLVQIKTKLVEMDERIKSIQEKLRTFGLVVVKA